MIKICKPKASECRLATLPSTPISHLIHSHRVAFPRNRRPTSPHRSSMSPIVAAATQDLPPPTPDPAKPPYASLSTPVYSLSTTDAQGGHSTINLMTYASAVSIIPRLYAVSLYRGTLSHKNMLESGEGVLQILGTHHAPLFELLGKQSGRSVDKLAELRQRGVPVVDYAGPTAERQGKKWAVLADCVGVMHLKVASQPVHAGDHDVVLCDVVDFVTLGGDGVEPLYTGILREKGYM